MKDFFYNIFKEIGTWMGDGYLLAYVPDKKSRKGLNVEESKISERFPERYEELKSKLTPEEIACYEDLGWFFLKYDVVLAYWDAAIFVIWYAILIILALGVTLGNLLEFDLTTYGDTGTTSFIKHTWPRWPGVDRPNGTMRGGLINGVSKGNVSFAMFYLSPLLFIVGLGALCFCLMAGYAITTDILDGYWQDVDDRQRWISKEAFVDNPSPSSEHVILDDYDYSVTFVNSPEYIQLLDEEGYFDNDLKESVHEITEVSVYETYNRTERRKIIEEVLSRPTCIICGEEHSPSDKPEDYILGDIFLLSIWFFLRWYFFGFLSFFKYFF